MHEHEHWKATECRYFLLHAAHVLNSVLPVHIYVHYMCLHVALRILPYVSSSAQTITYAELLLVYLVNQTVPPYGKEAVVYNVHAVTHLANDFQRLGALESFSCLPFENHLGMLRCMLTSGHRPHAQLWKRLSEKTNVADHACKSVQSSTVPTRMDHLCWCCERPTCAGAVEGPRRQSFAAKSSRHR